MTIICVICFPELWRFVEVLTNFRGSLHRYQYLLLIAKSLICHLAELGIRRELARSKKLTDANHVIQRYRCSLLFAQQEDHLQYNEVAPRNVFYGANDVK